MNKKCLVNHIFILMIFVFRANGVSDKMRSCFSAQQTKHVKKLARPADELRIMAIPNNPDSELVRSLYAKQCIFGEVIDNFILCWIIREGKKGSILYIPHYIYVFLFNKNDWPLVEYIYQSEATQKTLILVTMCTNPNVNDGNHWVLGVINLYTKKITILNSLLNPNNEDQERYKQHFAILFQILRTYYKTKEFKNGPSTKSAKIKVNKWQFILAKNAEEQYNSFDCGLYVCIHAYCYITNTQFFRLTSKFGREWLYNNHLSYIKMYYRSPKCSNSSNFQSDVKKIIDMCGTEITELENKIDKRITISDVNENELIY
ncbi:uncharacterized protein LOC126895585 [Daktulosphaira vitifoliae]|uniref:uncharacterized protein LOC126895585 n=1 Tax=Daktulosphaira vitifoliae TaxID=58002 RepID=UPI0021AAEDCB|nr:uncharacterized protein LOC126895585 [Daktulosphaira vitifoliae]